MGCRACFVCRHGPGPCKLPDAVWVRARDFFVLDEDSTIGINGGHPPIYLFNEGMLDDLLTRSSPRQGADIGADQVKQSQLMTT